MHEGLLFFLERGPIIMTSSRLHVASCFGYSRTLALAAAALAGVALSGSRAAAQDSVEVTEVSTEMMEAGPQDLPGREDGPRTRPPVTPPAPEPAKPEELPDWFGGKPFWEWSRITGNWGGFRDTLEAKGLTFAASYTLDWSSVWDGGTSRRASTRTLFDINATLELEKLCGSQGGKVFADFYSSDMRGGSRFVGDVQGTDNNETGDNVDQLAELWFEQTFFDNIVRLKIGKIDANSEFAVTLHNPYHMHISAAVSPTMLSMPIYPDPALGVVLFVYPLEQLYLAGGAFDGSLAAGKRTGRHGFQDLGRDDEAYFIGEAGYTWAALFSMGSGRVAGGGWVNTATFNRFDGGTESDTSGVYVLAEQQIFKRDSMPDDDKKGFFVFLRGGFADEAVATVESHFGAGFSINGTFDGRDDDAFGFMVSFADLSDDPASGLVDDETAIELFYRFQVTPFMSIMPDIQFIMNPGGAGAIEDAVVGSVRLELSF